MQAPRMARTLMACGGVIGLFGCAGEGPTSPPSGPGASLSVGSLERPLTGTCETSFAPPTFPPPPVIQQVDQGTCQLAHLGRTAFYAVQEIDLATGTQRSLEITFTSANGDVLRAASVGTSTPAGPGVAFQAAMTFIGGTGRFAWVTGSAQVVGTASFLTNTASFTLEGWLGY